MFEVRQREFTVLKAFDTIQEAVDYKERLEKICIHNLTIKEVF